ncbi:RidA family protein [Leucobacter soli]|uniref:Aminoacrylate peracid reductase RutC n=1 Tax=Leucobacter soli TaxID=2812850 RepID=A0A916JZR8_9MICO|nr:RidA family protein [Leucobacter soli]CAG7615597.1 Putative aminoacrylate peracid reductase RutC [Leucobacter soli]
MIARSVPTSTSNRVVVHNGILYLGGLGALDRPNDTDMYGQTQQICTRIDEFLAGAGTSKDHLLRATIYISDHSLKGEMNRAWNEWLTQEQKPARATITVGDMGDNLLVEIEITAAVPAA